MVHFSTLGGVMTKKKAKGEWFEEIKLSEATHGILLDRYPPRIFLCTRTSSVAIAQFPCQNF